MYGTDTETNEELADLMEPIGYEPERAIEGFGYKDQQGVMHIRQSQANKVIAAYTLGGALLGALAMHFKMRG